jgi:hypothetical protein
VKTGKDVVQKGPYFSNCCMVELELQKHQMFPRCPKCMKLTQWEPTSQLISRDKKAA